MPANSGNKSTLGSSYQYRNTDSTKVNAGNYMGSSGVSSIVAGSGITVTPSGGTGQVIITNSGGGGGGVSSLVAGSNVTLNPSGGTGNVTVNAQYPGNDFGGYLMYTNSTTGYIPQSDQVRIGNDCGRNGQQLYTVAVGFESGKDNQRNYGVAIGFQAGTTGQQSGATAIGYRAGYTSQQRSSIAIGPEAGRDTQGTGAIAIGQEAGCTDSFNGIGQGENAVAIGLLAGIDGQQSGAVAIGIDAGSQFQGTNSVAIGSSCGLYSFGSYAVAIGFEAGTGNLLGANLGQYSVAIGTRANQIPGVGTNQNIVINASGAAVNSTTSQACYVSPIRSVATNVGGLGYIFGTKEVYFNPAKSFIIDHPDDLNKYLVHACLEGPEAGVYYRGEGEILPSQKFVEIELPNYVSHFSDFTINVTQIIEDEDDELNLFASTRVFNNKFKVFGKSGKFFWTVFGKRLHIDTEPNKSDVNVKGDGPYKYISA